MATLTLTQTQSLTTNLTANFSFLLEDANRDGFDNLGSAANTLSLNRSFVIGGQVHEVTTNFKINAQGGNDVITTAAGHDVVYAGSGNDTVSTGKGNDQLYGGSGDDKLFAGADADHLDGGSGNDTLDGGTGNDVLIGGTGNDTLNGGNDQDQLSGGDGNDILNGGQGNDSIGGGNGNDTMTGGAGSDFFAISLNGGADVITDFNRDEDSIFLSMDILSQLPDTFQGARDVAAALFNANVAVDGTDFTLSYGPYGNAPVLIFDAATQMLSFDQDGLAGEGAAIDLVRLVGVTHLDGSEFFAPAPF